MARTTGRMLELLGLLQTPRVWSGEELCTRLEISERTLRRDIEDLRGLGYGIDSVPGLGGGYRTAPGAAVPPLVLSPEEAVAIAVGLRAAAVTAVTGIEEAAALALIKLERSLSSATRHRITSVDRAVVTLGRAREPVDVEAVGAVAHAIQEARRLRIDYSSHDGTPSSRTVEPHRIVHTPRRWYLLAWDVERSDWRTLRLDRLTPRVPLGERFTPREVPDEQVRALTVRAITTSPYPLQGRVRVMAPAHQVAGIFGPSVADVTDLGDGTTELLAGTVAYEEFAVYLGTSGLDFVVLEPDALRVAVRAVGERMVRAAAAS